MAGVSIEGSPDEATAFLLKGEPRVSLRGSASTVVEATTVNLSIIITADAPTSAMAAGLIDQKTTELLDKLKAAGIERGQMKVPKFTTITPRYGNSENVKGYSASSSLTAELSEQKQYLDLIAVTDRISGVSIADLQYDHSQLANIHKTILANACKRVLTRKEIYEQNLGVTLRPISFTEEDGTERPSSADGSRFGQIPVKASIRVLFEVIPNSPTPALPTSTTAPSQKPEQSKKAEDPQAK